MVIFLLSDELLFVFCSPSSPQALYRPPVTYQTLEYHMRYAAYKQPLKAETAITYSFYLHNKSWLPTIFGQ